MDDWLAPYIGKVVIVDLDEYYLIIGTLAQADAHHLSFFDADLHDHREANSTKDVYAMESLKIGVRANRAKVSIPRHRVVAISALTDLLL